MLWYNLDMNLDKLRETRSEIETTYANLSNPQWVSNELTHLKGKYEILNEVIKNLEGEQNAAGESSTGSSSNIDISQGE